MNFWRNLHPLLRRDKNNDYGSANYAVLSSLADSLSDAEQETIQNKSQLILKTASGLYLDEWGSWFGVTRKSKETDDDYRERIMWYLLVPRSTIEGIITGIKYYLDDNDANISVHEPWKNILLLNKSKLNGDGHLQGFYYRYAVIDVSIDRPMSKTIYDAIMAFKPAGVKFYVTFNPNMSSKVSKLTLAELKAKRLYTIEKAYGFMYDHKLPVTFSDRPATLVKNTNYLKLNDSKMNGEDVLAGSPTHNVTYWNPLSLSTSLYKDVPVNLASGTNQKYTMGGGITDTTWKDGYAYEQLPTTISGGGEILPQWTHDFWYTPTQGVTYTQTIWFETDATVKDLGTVQITWFTKWVHDYQPAIVQKLGQNSYKIVSTYTWPVKPNNKLRLFDIVSLGSAFDLNTGTYLKFGKLKLEEGNISTPWSPNPTDPEYYASTPTNRAILSSLSNTYVSLPSSATSMVSGTLSVYNQFITNYSSLLSTYSGNTEYDRVRSLVKDPNTTVFIVVNADVPLTINGVHYPAGLSSIPVGKGSLNYTGSDINIPVSVTGTQDARVYYVYAKLKVSKDTPGLGVNIKASQNVSIIKNGPVVGTSVVGTAVLGQATTIGNAK